MFLELLKTYLINFIFIFVCVTRPELSIGDERELEEIILEKIEEWEEEKASVEVVEEAKEIEVEFGEEAEEEDYKGKKVVEEEEEGKVEAVVEIVVEMEVKEEEGEAEEHTEVEKEGEIEEGEEALDTIPEEVEAGKFSFQT